MQESVFFDPFFMGQKRYPKNLCDKDFAEHSGELSGATCLKPLFYWRLTANPLELFRKCFGAVRATFWLCESFSSACLTPLVLTSW